MRDSLITQSEFLPTEGDERGRKREQEDTLVKYKCQIDRKKSKSMMNTDSISSRRRPTTRHGRSESPPPWNKIRRDSQPYPILKETEELSNEELSDDESSHSDSQNSETSSTSSGDLETHCSTNPHPNTEDDLSDSDTDTENSTKKKSDSSNDPKPSGHDLNTPLCCFL